MPFIMEEDEPFDPANICFLGHVAIVSGSDRVADLVKELWLWRDRWRRDIHGRLPAQTYNFESVADHTFYFGILHGDLPLIMVILTFNLFGVNSPQLAA